ncbi:3-hydroxy-3-methylglutaryl-CoA reductase [marine gamma proteobacterium HTCC2207]|jgi:hydroxymethylglutaryl-CoA reductase (NADPH)|uniref:hydroxymethylglutaryl-CoA reductase (NADPH) n=1 Tax=gamma proteobacterium HTCC2207 TaxID=314287 RepID=Q1YR67_9GAMM|nr:3-hydroxy-3-methylglutaryl-CoA reductase [marine gamma proteobacterium HTCC2207] [gamma proteobacterium HTCC2207]MBT5105229.1 hydroxymethylglutaryl-CoA reductase [Porticoccaceae bacterium]MDC3261246.1 hydroxymethylglutaryl-CoA reductase [bacterium]MBT6114518.1 hydroxymethylglutaryl-CoA reductase [Porticoccaceae bacterium]MDB4427623.1 hydroxymethylglutaryl-CoA reductase [Porticoccaceae bacterium]
MSDRIPRDSDNDYSEVMAKTRRDFAADKTSSKLDHIGHYSVDPATTAGNIENFIGVAQVPLGLIGPLRVNGEHASGDFYVPMATSEGTLIASYNRGARLLRDSGGVKVTVVDDAMQRAPVFVFNDAREARDFGLWVEQNVEEIAAQAETTTSSGKLRNIEQYAAARMRYLRFNFTTGDAAGQNMVGKATFIACEWIMKTYPGIQRYMLSGAMDTDKKHSQINTLHSRGKRVVAEVLIPGELLEKTMGVTAEVLFKARQINQVGSFMAGSSSTGAHAANGIAAVFIATGQDAANVAESSSSIIFADVDKAGNYYLSITLPSLIVATYGGGTGLPTQQECLDMLGCNGAGKVHKLAEIIGATVLAGEVSLMSAVLAGDWVTSHDALGRNR